MRDRFIIYALTDPRDGQIRYIGKSCSGVTRARNHSVPSIMKADAHLHKARWIRSLMDAGLSFGVQILERHETADTLAEAEIAAIRKHRLLGAPLTNSSDGGIGGRLGAPHSEETKAKIAATRLGKKLSSEIRRKMSLAHKGHKQSAEWVAKRVVQHKGAKRSDEARANMRASHHRVHPMQAALFR